MQYYKNDIKEIFCLTDYINNDIVNCVEVEYFKTKKGSSPVEKFIKRQDVEVQAEIQAEIDRFKSLGYEFLWNFPKRGGKIKDMMELKIKSQRKHYRFLFIFVGEKILFLPGFIKKTRKINPRDVKLAEQRKKEYLTRR